MHSRKDDCSKGIITCRCTAYFDLLPSWGQKAYLSSVGGRRLIGLSSSYQALVNGTHTAPAGADHSTLWRELELYHQKTAVRSGSFAFESLLHMVSSVP